MKKLAHKTILLIEENESELLEIKSWINKVNENHTLCVVRDCREALDLLNGNTHDKCKVLPDIVLLSIYSSKMDGVEFIGIIQNYFSLRSIQIFFMIPGFSGDLRIVSKQFNVDGIIAKPFHLNLSEGQTTSLEMLKEKLTDSNGLRLQSLFIFPALISEGLSGLKNLAKQLLEKIEFARSTMFLKPVAIATFIVTTALVTTATTISFKKKNAATKNNRIENTVVNTVSVQDKPKVKINPGKKKPARKTIKSIVQDINDNKIDNVSLKPDSIIVLPVKATEKPLKIVVVEEDEESEYIPVK